MAITIASISSDPKTINADGKSKAIITAIVSDKEENVNVNWTVDNEKGSLSAETSKTDKDGKALVELTATEKGNYTVTAKTDDDPTGKDVEIEASEKTTATIENIKASSEVIPSDESLSSVISATLSSKQKDISVQWKLNDDIGKLSDTVTKTDESGLATTVLSASSPGIITVIATTEDDQDGESITIIASEPLTAPHVLNANEDNGYTLDHYAIDFGVSAIVPHYSNAQSGSSVEFHWGEHSLQFELDNPNTDLPRDINVSKDMPPEALSDGVYNVYYTVTDQADNTSISSAANITVLNSGETVPTLTKPGVTTNANNYINIEIAKAGVTVDIAAYTGIAKDDVITLYWVAYDNQNRRLAAYSNTYTIKVKDENDSLTVALDSSLFFSEDGSGTETGYEGHVEAYYTVLSAAASTAGQALLSYTNEVQVKTTPAS